MKNKFACLVFCLAGIAAAKAQSFITDKKEPGSFTIVHTGGAVASILSDENDYWLVNKAVSLLQSDIESVSGAKPFLLKHISQEKNMIIVGSIGHSAVIDQLIKNKKLNTDDIKGKWEAYRIQVISNPLPGIDNALVIAGSDKRGTAFGVFELSRQIGVSPWYWWADVPVKKHSDLYVARETNIHDQPSVKYRGIFINDEAPSFSGWTKEKFGGVNHLVYEKMFELLLRLKSNFLWPAMWSNAFNEDDTLNPVLADQYGIVMSTSHHEPMLRAQQEWKRFSKDLKDGKGEWNYATNDSVLRGFWCKGIQNMGTHESVVTVGMRGDGDKPMTQGSNTELLEKIVADQRKIIEDVTGKPANQTPQVWALYKEVQDYYDKGMRVPDDVTLLLCDDNWGNLRKLPKLTDAPRKGGYGIYYHFDYVGGPRNYKWLNTSPIARTWEQMHLAYEYGVRDIWVVNVGDLKPMEFPISFWCDYAWNPEKIKATDLQSYTEKWAAEQFGSAYAKEIADIISKYTKYNGRRKPELLDANTFNGHQMKGEGFPSEMSVVTKDYNDLLVKAERINNLLSPQLKDAYYELVLHPVKACANLYDMYKAVAMNKEYAAFKYIGANEWADEAKQDYIKDSLISIEYNSIANGKWNHMMDQTHIGYTYWQQPSKQKMPDVKYISKDSAADVNIAMLLGHGDVAFVFNNRIRAIVDFERFQTGNKFYESDDNYISIQADHFTKAVNTDNIKWQILPDHGKTGNAITPMPVTAATQTPGSNAPHLEYEFYTYDSGSFKIQAYFSPTLNFHNDEGLKYAISVDDEAPQIVVLNKDDNNTRIWEGWVANNIIIKTTSHSIASPGKHTIKYWMVSPAVVLQKIVADFGGVKPSYLGPHETLISSINN